MVEPDPEQKTPEHLGLLSQALTSGTRKHLQRIISAMHPAEIANLLESLPLAQRELVWDLVDKEVDGEVLVNLAEEVRATLVSAMEAEELLAATEGLEIDDIADLLQGLPDKITREVLQGMDQRDRARVEQVLYYAEDTAGGLMNTDTVTVRADVTLDVVLRYLRRRGALPATTDALMVVNRYDKFRGILPLTTLLTNDPEDTVAEVMDRDTTAIPATTAASEVARLFEDRDLISAAVVDDQSRLLGRITIDDVVDVIREEGEHSVMSMAGLSEEEDVFGPILPSARRRAVWLGVNLLTAFLAAWVIGRFQGTLEQLVALAVLMPIVASMGGIAGSQTLTLVIRGLSLGQVNAANSRWLLTKEIAVGVLNGLTWALVVAAIAVFWFRDLGLGGILATALIINLFAAALAGVGIPLIMKRLGIDPALGGAVVLTTVTDVIGFLSFLGLASLWLI